MRVYLNRAPVSGPWGGGNLFVSAFHKRAPALCDFVIDQTGRTPIDVILLAGLENDGYGISVDQAVMYKMYLKPDCQVVLRVNENDARKGTDFMDERLVAVSEHLDGTIFVSEWLRDYFKERGWKCQNNTVIYNGVARDVFAPQPKLNNGKVNIVAHHWSDNRMKGADIYEKLDEFVGENPDHFTFTYIGRHQCDFKHTKVIKPLAGKALGEELGKYDLYVSASRFDPGPNHILEALSCGLPTLVHKDGGGCCEFAGHNCVYSTWEQLQAMLESGELPVQEPIKLRTWQECVQEYIGFLEATWKATSGSQSS
jgi:glycosyltransferase involved in cell wall biosynthesis